MEVIKEKIKTRECIENIKREIKIEQSYIIPDIKPDIIKSIISNGNIFIEKIEMQTKRIKLDGRVITFNMYLDSEENNNNLDTEMTFSEIIDTNANIDNAENEASITLNNIELKILNERKVHILANATVNVSIYKENEIDIINNVIEKDNKIQKLENKMSIENLIGDGSTRIGLKENIKITDVEKVINIVKVDYKIESLESKISYNKVLAKGEVVLEISYRTEENKISKFSTKLPIMGFIDILDVTDNDICKLKMNVTDFGITISSENTVDLQMEFNCMCNVYENKEINVIEDIYGIKENYKYEKRNIKLDSENSEKLLTKNINEKVLVDNINQLYDTRVYVDIKNKNNENGVTKYVGRVNVIYIYDTFDNRSIDSMSSSFEFEFEISDKTEDIEIMIENANFIILPDSSIDNRIELSIMRKSKETRNIELIENIEPDDKIDTSSYSLVIYFVQKGDSLWKIAKKFRSTVELIARINNIEDIDRINIGQKLYIPKAV